MSDAGQEDPVEVAQHIGEWLGLVRGAGGQTRPDVAGGDLGQHWQLADPLQVVRRPVDGGVPVATKIAHARAPANS